MSRRILLISDGEMDKHIKMESIQDFYNKVAEMKIKIDIKPHPNGEPCIIPDNYNKKEDYIPAELILNNYDIILGCFSIVLTFASKLYYPCISGIKLLEFVDEEIYNIWLNRLYNSSNGWILFPDNYNSLEKMLKY